jgi:hypothetical protein
MYRAMNLQMKQTLNERNVQRRNIKDAAVTGLQGMLRCRGSGQADLASDNTLESKLSPLRAFSELPLTTLTVPGALSKPLQQTCRALLQGAL